MTIEIPERFTWAASLVQAAPHDQVLEIGCGTGILAELICRQIITGHYTGIDRSLSMLEKAEKRNQQPIRDGLASFIAGDFANTPLPSGTFDKIIAFNVPFFRKTSAAELTQIRRILKKNGQLFVFLQEPYEISENASEPIKERLTAQGLFIKAVHLQALSPTAALGIIARAGEQ